MIANLGTAITNIPSIQIVKVCAWVPIHRIQETVQAQWLNKGSAPLTEFSEPQQFGLRIKLAPM
jgi:hypothetical protein